MTTASQPLPPELLNRLLIGRDLLRNSPSNLTPQSDALLVARAILAAQDASELVISAIAQHVGAERAKASMGLMDYIGGIEKATNKAFAGRHFFDSLNRARVSFKHHGHLPNAQEFHLARTRSEDLLEQACSDYLGVPLSDLDLSMLIADLGARLLFIDAVEFNKTGRYREALERLAQALRVAVDTSPLPFNISPGEPDSQTALQLTAHGVDPGAFIRMQEFLPRLYVDDEIKWDTRAKGHEANWRERNVTFCLATCVDLIRKIQYAEYQPTAVEFSFVFDDVLTAIRDRVVVRSQHWIPLFSANYASIRPFGEMKKGQQILGAAVPAYEDGNGKWNECQFFDLADIFVIKNPVSDMSEPIPEHHVLIVGKDDVEWSYRAKEGMKEHFPHFFSD